MYPQTHFLFSLLIGLIFVKLGVFDYKIALLIAIFSVLIDSDHFINFALRRKNYSLRDAWNAIVIRHFHGRTFIHHIVGFILITFLIIFLFFANKNFFWIVSVGYYSHMFLDYAKINFLKIKGKMTIKESGFIEKISKFEILLDIFLMIGIILLIL